jgi:hypothetical protein
VLWDTSIKAKPTKQETKLTVNNTDEMVKTAVIPMREKKYVISTSKPVQYGKNILK